MKFWCIRHPWMTLFIAITAMESTERIVKHIIREHKADKRPILFEGTKEEIQEDINQILETVQAYSPTKPEAQIRVLRANK